MKLNLLASAIQRGTFLIDTRSADVLYPIAERFLRGEKVIWADHEPEAKKEFLDTFVMTKENARYNLKADSQNPNPQDFYADAPEGSIAWIPIQGAIMKEDYCGSTGTDSVSAWLMAALASPNIIGAVLQINSPGGAVEGTNECADTIAFVNSLMPVEVFCDGQLCSAAVWLACALRITASSGTVEIGCIGTAASYKDYSKGSTVVSHYITADASFDKNKEAIEVFKNNYSLIKNNIINPTNDIFLNQVKTGRGDKLQLTDVKDDQDNVIGQYPLTGQIYLAGAALQLGLIDAIGNRDTVLESIRNRAAQSSTSNQINNMSLFGTKFKKLNALSGKKAAEISDEEIVAVNQELHAEGIENVVIISASHLTEADGNADVISEGLTSLNAALGLTGDKAHKTLNTALSALVTAHKAEFDRAEAYGKNAGEKPTAPVVKPAAAGEPAPKEGGEQLPVNTANKFETSYDRELAAAKKLDIDNPFK